MTKTRFPPFHPITIEGSVTGKSAVARPMLEEGKESQKYRDQGNWKNLAIKGLSEKILDASYSKEEIVQEVHTSINVLSEKIETIHVDLNEGFKKNG